MNEIKKSSQRDKSIDIMRGIAIILMVVGHSSFWSVGTKFIYLFHMAVFFMISGYLMRFKYESFFKDTWKYVLKKLIGLWLPCFLWNLIYTLFNNVFLKIHIYSDTAFAALDASASEHSKLGMSDMLKNILRGVVMSGNTEMGGAFWFLKTLFAVSIMFFIVDYILHLIIKKETVKEIVHAALAALILTAGWYCGTKNITTMGIPIVLTSYGLYYLGHAIKITGIMKKIPGIVAAAVATAVLITSTIFGPSISVGNNNYGPVWYLLINSLAGWVLLYHFSLLIEKVKFGRVIETVGCHTLAIVVLHFLVFKIVSLVQILVHGHPITYLALFPAFSTNGAWWMAYTLLGVGAPVLLDILWMNIKKNVIKK